MRRATRSRGGGGATGEIGTPWARCRRRAASGSSVLKEAGAAWLRDQAPTLAAALSYHAVLALAPLVLIAAAVTGVLFGEGEARDQLLRHAAEWLGQPAVGAVELVLDSVVRAGASGVAFAVGGVLVLFAASGAFRQLRSALNRLWHVERTPAASVRGSIAGWLLNHVFSVGLVLAVTLALVGLLAFSVVWGEVINALSSRYELSGVFWKTTELLVGLVLQAGVFAAVFAGVPQARPRGRDLAVGAATTAVLFSVGRIVLDIYFATGSTGTVYGAAGALVVFLIWMYYSAMILYFGAVLTRVWAVRHGRSLRPKAGARLYGERARDDGRPDDGPPAAPA